MNENVPLYVIGLSNDEPAANLLKSKFDYTLEKAKKFLPEIIEAKISVEFQNPEGERTHYDVTSVITTTKNRFIYTESGWDILKICDELCRKLEGEFPSDDDKRKRESIRKKEYY
jgi:hypothetical protein